MKIILVCDKCRFIFSRTVEPEQYLDCGKCTVCEANKTEHEEQTVRGMSPLCQAKQVRSICSRRRTVKAGSMFNFYHFIRF